MTIAGHGRFVAVPRFSIQGVEMKYLLSIGLVVAIVAVLPGCANTNGDVADSQVKAIQGEARSAVPSNLPKVPVEDATKGLANPAAGGTLNMGDKLGKGKH